MFQNTVNTPPPKSPSQLIFLFKPNATIIYDKDPNFKFIYILDIIQLMKV